METVSRYNLKFIHDTDKVNAAAITEMDWSIGNVTAAIKAIPDAWENTVVIFLSDNGGGQTRSYNHPFRGGKYAFYEGGIRSEAFVYSSQFLPVQVQGTEWNGLFHVTDWYVY